jgi:uncharacterized BrkB/YihY/UPF0761 family membrane protein
MFIEILITLNLCWIGNKYYELANNHDRSKWSWAMFGFLSSVIAFALSSRIFGLYLTLKFELGLQQVELLFLLVVNVIQFIILKFLEKRWEKKIVYEGDDEDIIEDIGKK